MALVMVPGQTQTFWSSHSLKRRNHLPLSSFFLIDWQMMRKGATDQLCLEWMHRHSIISRLPTTSPPTHKLIININEDKPSASSSNGLFIDVWRSDAQRQGFGYLIHRPVVDGEPDNRTRSGKNCCSPRYSIFCGQGDPTLHIE